MTRRGRWIGWGASAVGVAILLGLGFALRGKIAEEWYLYRLRTGDARVKEHAAGMLHALSSTRAPYLIHRLRLGEERFFPACVAGLSRAGSEAVGPLVGIVRDGSLDHNIRRHAAEALGRIGRPAWASAPALVEYLGEVGFEPGLGWREVDSRSIDPRKSIWHYRSTCATVITALGRMDPEDTEVVGILSASIAGFARQLAVEALAGMAPHARESVPALGRALEVPSLDNRLEADFRFTVTQSLVRFGPDAAPAMASLRQALQDQWRKVRSGAAEALGAIGPGAAEAIPDLEALLADRNESVREAAAAALAKIRG
jgi:HEAT repeat protein